MRRVRYCGLVLDSALALPGLPEASPEAPTDLEVLLGPVPEALPGERRRSATWAHDGRSALWWLEGVGRYHLAEGGRRITLQPDPHPGHQADEAGLRLMLLQPVMALAGVLRGDWMLNAAAVERDGEVCAFIGPSASGKSTAAALMVAEGWRLVSDSLLRVSVGADGRLLAHPQAPWLELWPDSIEHALAQPGGTGEALRPGLALRRIPAAKAEGALPLARIGRLKEQRGNDLGDFLSRPRGGRQGFQTLLQHTAGKTWHEQLGSRRALFEWAVALTTRCPLASLDLPWGWSQCGALGEALRQWCRGGPGAQPLPPSTCRMNVPTESPRSSLSR